MAALPCFCYPWLLSWCLQWVSFLFAQAVFVLSLVPWWTCQPCAFDLERSLKCKKRKNWEGDQVMKMKHTFHGLALSEYTHHLDLPVSARCSSNLVVMTLCFRACWDTLHPLSDASARGSMLSRISERWSGGQCDFVCFKSLCVENFPLNSLALWLKGWWVRSIAGSQIEVRALRLLFFGLVEHFR